MSVSPTAASDDDGARAELSELRDDHKTDLAAILKSKGSTQEARRVVWHRAQAGTHSLGLDPRRHASTRPNEPCLGIRA